MSLYLGNQRISNLGETFTPREIQSVNGKYSVDGNITVYGSDMKVSQSDNRTIEAALSDVSRIDLSEYYKKTETSSDVQLSVKFGNYYTKDELSTSVSAAVEVLLNDILNTEYNNILNEEF